MLEYALAVGFKNFVDHEFSECVEYHDLRGLEQGKWTISEALITRRSQVQILPPLLERPAPAGPSCSNREKMGFRLGIAVFVTLLVALAAQAGASGAAKGKGQICGQIKHGPYAVYRRAGRTVKGRTWTVIAVDAPCGVSMRLAPKVLRWWAKAKVGATGSLNEGRHDWLVCKKPDAGDLGFPAAACGFVDPSYSAHADLAILMTGKKTVAQVRKLIH